ncbi:hypothetical protein Q3G72_028139 [Acer saccharum]|nr:hypothetical protein Q3G72_028139 [Acer saccharum]
MALPSAGNAKYGDSLVQSYAHAVAKPVDNPSFKIPMRFPVDINGELGFIFSEPEMAKAAEDYKFAIVMKFMHARPSIDNIRFSVVKTWGLMETPTISFMDDYHVLIQMKNERDFVHGWTREGRTMEGISFRLFKWTKEFDLHRESPLAPQWIFLPGLPMHLYRRDCLQIFATRFGRYLGTDNATLNRTRATGARIYVEVDLTMEPVKGFPILVSQTKCIWQEARYEKPGFYCMKCHRQGHTAVVCRAGEGRKGVGKPKGETKVWQSKNKITKGEVSGSIEGLEIEVNTVLPDGKLTIIREDSNVNQNNFVIEGTSPGGAMIETESNHGLRNSVENQKEDSNEECEEVWGDEELEVVQETVQTQIEKSPVLPGTPIPKPDADDYIGGQKGDLALVCYSDREEREITVLKGKEKAYDSDGVVPSDLEKINNGVRTVRKSQRVHTQAQKLNL